MRDLGAAHRGPHEPRIGLALREVVGGGPEEITIVISV